SVLQSHSHFTTGFSVNWGGGSYTLVAGDYDGDAKADLGLYDKNTGSWYVLLSGAGFTTARTINWGGAGYVPVSDDFDGDGSIDAAIFQPATGTWYVLKSSTNYTTTFSVAGWGSGGDVPISGAIAISSDTERATDYDGDAGSDITVYNIATGVWS